eukprot:971898-Rhodomonas_salina.1
MPGTPFFTVLQAPSLCQRHCDRKEQSERERGPTSPRHPSLSTVPAPPPPQSVPLRPRVSIPLLERLFKICPPQSLPPHHLPPFLHPAVALFPSSVPPSFPSNQPSTPVHPPPRGGSRA